LFSEMEPPTMVEVPTERPSAMLKTKALNVNAIVWAPTETYPRRPLMTVTTSNAHHSRASVHMLYKPSLMSSESSTAEGTTNHMSSFKLSCMAARWVSIYSSWCMFSLTLTLYSLQNA